MKKRTFEVILASGMTFSIICYLVYVVLIAFGILCHAMATVGTALLISSYMFMLIFASRIKEDEE